MKKFLMLFVGIMLMFSIGVYAQEIAAEPDNPISSLVFDLSTFTGIVAVISLIVTQIAKFLPVIDSRAIFKILTSIVVGCLTTLIAWRFNLAEFLDNISWLQMLIHGVSAGLMASGAYGLIKSAISGKK